MSASVPQPIPRIALIWLLVAQALVILPHLTHLPPWVGLLWAFCAGWRVLLFRMKVRAPTRIEKGGLLLLTMGGIWLSRGSFIGLDAGAVLLLVTFALKLIEMHSRRDALVVIYLGFFAVVIAYLFEDGLLAALYSLLPVTALVAALIGLQQSALASRPLATLKVAGSLLLQAVPLMLLLFLVFPRIGPLWSLPQPGDQARTGLGDSMAPGEIAQLSQSAERVFRVSFDGERPAQRDLYWRATTYEHFDGTRWSVDPDTAWSPEPAWTPRGPSLAYQVIMEPSGRPWLYGLDVARSDQRDVRLASDFHLQRRRPVDQALLYRATSWPQALREPGRLSASSQRRALQLPSGGEPRTRAWVAQLKARYPAPEALAGAILAYFRQQPFVYTLQPPTASVDAIDAFLFDNRRGFCAHYAGAMTFALRVAGIPARVVAGYQGGEFNAAGGYLLVRQFDAHAWVEYWLPERGWVSVDPTAQVAPERVERGLQEALAAQGAANEFLADNPFAADRYRHLAWLTSLRLGWDRINYGWQRWVLNYEGDTQGEVFKRLLGEGSLQRLGLLLAAAVLGLLGVMALLVLKPWQRQRDPLLARFAQFERLLARQGVIRHSGEPAGRFAQRAIVALPAARAEIAAFAEEFQAQRYAGRPLDPAALRRALQQLRRGLRGRQARSD
ncbi:transglutaminase [Pseudomonas oryzihabitans]|nr:transglutaminase [Pseudomonas psychrotolerans]